MANLQDHKLVHMAINHEKIDNLWNWFFQNEYKIRYYMENESDPSDREYLVGNLDNLVLDLGMFSWEIGTGTNKRWSFTISPNGDKDLMKMSEEIIEEAPDLTEWEFNYCKPAKNWDRRFIIYDDNLNQQEINASNWKYIATQREDGMIELLLEAHNISHLDRDSALSAADLVVLYEIGEESKIQNVCSIDIVFQFDEHHNSHKSDIKHLKKHIEAIGMM